MSELARQTVYDELAAAQVTFRRLVSDLTPDDLRRRTNGTKWTNREMLFHMLLGYFVVRALVPLVKAFGVLPAPVSRAFAAVLNAGSRPFHMINYLGSRMGGHMSPPWMQRRFDRVCGQLARRLARESERNLARGMCMPTRWDPFFKPYMTLCDVYRYPTQHFEFHRRQLTPGGPGER